MNITVNASKLMTNAKNGEMKREEAIDYAKTSIDDALSVYSLEPESVDVSMWTEGSQTDPVQKITIRAVFKHQSPIIQSEHSRDIGRAIDRACDTFKRQIRKMKTAKIDHSRERRAEQKESMRKTEENDINEE